MAEYIERAAVLECYQMDDPVLNEVGHVPLPVIRQNIMDIPAADVAPVRHGKWTVLDECSNAGAYCSVCHKKVYRECYGNCKMKSKYCPNCGAKMDLEGGGGA